jgi:hypothetical protein
VKTVRVRRAAFDDAAVKGWVLARDVADASGRVALAKGRILAPDDSARLRELPWDELHLLAPEPDDLHESGAGARLARAAAGPGVAPGQLSAGHWPLVAQHRGVLQVNVAGLLDVNRLCGLGLYTLFDGQVVDSGEQVGRAKIVPFLIAEEIVVQAESLARSANGLVAVRPFGAVTVGAVVQESLGERASARFRDALAEKVEWFGARLLEPRFVAPEADAVASAIRDVAADGASVVIVAGSRPMDPLDPAFEALERVGARVQRHGVPAHPGSLLWLARLGEFPVIGVPSCGLFSRATVVDLVLPRLLAGLPVDAAWMAGLGHGGFLTRDMAFRFPPYRPARDRGAVA